ncbi:MAG: beta-ketoacyl-ACP synthase II [Bacteroidia bacterium]|nr:beta-ketoacyl-ACP synthase II [Bacteroidia bacterium]MCZ2276520.1 beta-ketoacyl-ACP synthase II [Bacteroidia bacterium]
MLKRVVVTGLGALTPLGNNVEDSWKNLVAGVSGAGPITRFDASKFKTRFACEVKGFDPADYIERKEIRKMDPFTHYAIAVSAQGVADAGLENNPAIDPDRVGVIWGSGVGGIKTFQDEIIQFSRGDGTPRFNPFYIPKMIIDLAPGHISMRYGFRGPNFATVSACASSTNALIDAFNYIRLDQADIMISGGSEAPINESGVGGFNALHALSVRNDDPATASRPYDKDRDGFVIGEGGVCVILEELEHAKKRGAKIYAEVIGGGMSADAYHMTAPHPEGLGAHHVMENALRDAKIKPEEIDYINTHGTSTPIGDPQELKAIQHTFGEHAWNILISSTKSMTGHLLGGAGAVEAMVSILAIRDGIVPPTINHFTDDPEVDPRFQLCFHKAVKKDITTALSNTFGFGGHNATLIFKKYIF